MNDQQRLKEIAELKTLYDNIEALSKEMAGRANSIGFEMRVQEQHKDIIKIVEWVKAAFNPLSLAVKLSTSVLEDLRNKKTTDKNTKQAIKAIEDFMLWSEVAYDVATSISPVGLAKMGLSTGVSFLLKNANNDITKKLKKLKTTMDNLWKASKWGMQACEELNESLNQEIDKLGR